ncbi:hypothetical protein [Vibrio maerlii]|uniref:hypothetical protein n=1 Tax=Vibrio maerlii TaxID=2231648 RepID=UPI000E3CC16B|nr:hypothetical protein [Vibrio maerlii]
MKWRLLVFILTIIASFSALADIHVIVNSEMPIEQVSQSKLKNLYLGKTNQIDGTFVSGLIDREGDTKAIFYKTLTGLSLGQVNAYWARLRFSGRKKAPIEIGSQERLEALLIENEHVIGYSVLKPQTKNLKVILTLHE